MKQKRTIWLIVIGLILLLTLGYLLGTRPHNWQETYDSRSEDPYGTFLLAKLLEDYFPGKGFHSLQDSFELSLPLSAGDSARANYVFVGAGMYLRPSDLQRLLDFVKNGNQAIISAQVLPFDLMFELYFEECDSIGWDGLSYFNDSLAYINLDHPDLHEKMGFPYRFYEQDQVVPYNWSYFENYYFCGLEEGLTQIGTLNDSLINFAQRPYGAGNFYLHSTPLAFTNFHLLNKSNLRYVDKVFSHLQEGPIYWDEYSGVSEQMGQAINNRNRYPEDRRISANSPLQFILSKPPLTWAWYLLLAAGLLFMLFFSRRRQRIIPVLRKNTNTSLEFLSTIGHLYFLQNNHKQLAIDKMQLFRNFVREKYHLPGLDLDEAFQQKLGQRSEVSRPIIDKIFLMYNNIKNASFVTENTLIDFHKAVEQFYRHCK